MKTNEISERRLFGSLTNSSFKSLLPKSKLKMNSSTHRAKYRSNGENTAPLDPNIQIRDPPLSPTISFPKKSQSKVANSYKDIIVSEAQEKLPSAPSPPIKVVVRIRPESGLGSRDSTVRKVSNDSVSVGDRNFRFDSILDSKSTQEEIFEIVGVPVVKDALAGYNTSILAYGQTGSGKTYTMWGPPGAMVDGASASSSQGIAPRIFQSLFSEIQKEQENSKGKQINFQCRCSFLEIYNGKIGDLLDPTQRNLEIKDDSKNGLYVENLTEEYVTCYEDVAHLLIKGLSSRKVGATSINSKSSRSHIVFTCVLESWCKESSSKCFSSSKTSRVSLIDLASFEKNMPEGSSMQCVKDQKFVKKSTSQLGHLVNILAERSHSGKPDEIPYGRSCLTHLLKESLGGNTKLSVICAVAPDHNSSETISTLRFGQRAKLMDNMPVVNEITEDDVNDLSDQIRQLKEELIREKSYMFNSVGSNHGYFRGRSARESLNQLRLSLNRSIILPRIENESVEEEVCINENDVKELRLHIDNLHGSHETGDCTMLFSAEGCETDLTCEHYLSCSDESENEEINSGETQIESSQSKDLRSLGGDSDHIPKKSMAIDPPLRGSSSFSACLHSSVLQDPVLTESPKIKSTQRKSLVMSSNHLSDMLKQPEQHENMTSSLRSSRIFPGQTDSLAASLQRGLQIIDSHQRSSEARSSASFSFAHLALKPSSFDKANASVQTSEEERKYPVFPYVCSKCQGTSNETEDSPKTWMVPVEGSESSNRVMVQDVEKDLAFAIQREKELDIICKEQADKIEHLNQMLEQQKKCESDKNGVHEHSNCLSGEDKLLTWNNNEPEFIKEKCEIKEVQEEECQNKKKTFDVEEREALLKEIETLRSQLQSHAEAAPTKRSTDRLRASLLSQSLQLRRSSILSPGSSSTKELEKEREKWMEMESEWISLTDELRMDIESNRQKAEKVEMELKLEKKCTEELDDALKRSVLGHARMVEHYAELQEKYNDLIAKHRAITEAVAEIKQAAAKAGTKGHGARFQKALAAELSASRVEREREREFLRKENRSLKIQLKDTAEAVHAAGELLVRLREAEEAATLAEEKNAQMMEENEKLRKQMEKQKRKHKMEMITMKQYLAESRLPQAALQQPLLYREDSEITEIRDDNNNNNNTTVSYDDQAWRAEFGAIYQQHY